MNELEDKKLIVNPSKAHPFPHLYENSKQSGGLYLGASVWRNLEMEHALPMMQLYARCVQLGISFADQPVVGDAFMARSRSRAASDFLRSSRDVILFIDSDIYFAPDDALKIAEKAYEYDIVGGAYVKRDQEKTELVVRWMPGDFACDFDIDSPLHEVEYLGTGFLAVHRRVFERLLQTHEKDGIYPHHIKERDRAPNLPSDFTPFFRDRTREVQGNPLFLSEDWAFLQRAREAGFKVWLDPSVRLGHVGSYMYTLEDLYRPQKESPAPARFMSQGGKRVLARGIAHEEVVTKDGFKMSIDPEDTAVSYFVKKTGEWSPEVRQAILDHLQGGWTFLDLGANIGYYSLLAASWGNRVIAVEPNPEALQFFKKSIEMNGFENLIDLHEVAVAAEERKYTLVTRGLRNKGEAHLSLLNEKVGPVVQGKRLESILLVDDDPEFGLSHWPEMIKMDIEGEEWNVLKDNEKIFEEAYVVIFEVSEEQLRRNSQVGEDELVRWFIDHDFKLAKLVDNGNHSDWIATKP